MSVSSWTQFADCHKCYGHRTHWILWVKQASTAFQYFIHWCQAKSYDFLCFFKTLNFKNNNNFWIHCIKQITVGFVI